MDQEEVGDPGSGPPGDSRLSANKRVEEPEGWGQGQIQKRPLGCSDYKTDGLRF